MPPLPIITNVWRVALEWLHSGTGQIAANVIHIRTASTSASAVAAAIAASFLNKMWTTVSSGASMHAMDLTRLDGSSASYHTTVSGQNGQGSSGDFEPGSSTVVGLHTALRGRSHRGRVYLPFLAEGQASNGLLTTGQATTALLGWSYFVAHLPLQTPLCFLVVASYKLSTATDVVTTPVLRGYGTQRRRQERVRYP